MAIEKIVVVDDEMMIRKALETQLRNKRYSVASTGDLKGARKILARDSFDLVFLDLRLARWRRHGSFGGNYGQNGRSHGCNDDRLWFC